jgi:hypothetical protein
MIQLAHKRVFRVRPLRVRSLLLRGFVRVKLPLPLNDTDGLLAGETARHLLGDEQFIRAAFLFDPAVLRQAVPQLGVLGFQFLGPVVSIVRLCVHAWCLILLVVLATLTWCAFSARYRAKRLLDCRWPANSRLRCEYVTPNFSAAVTAPGHGRYLRLLNVWHAIAR